MPMLASVFLILTCLMLMFMLMPSGADAGADTDTDADAGADAEADINADADAGGGADTGTMERSDCTAHFHCVYNGLNESWKHMADVQVCIMLWMSTSAIRLWVVCRNHSRGPQTNET